MAFFVSLFLALIQASTYVPPVLQRTDTVGHPPNIIAGSWALLDVELDRQGNIKSIGKVSGENPFVDLAITSVRQWHFAPAQALTQTAQGSLVSSPAESHVIVAFLFRARDLFPGYPILASAPSRNSPDSPAFPVELADPGYPVASLGEGPTIVELQISDKGEVGRTRVVSDVPSLGSFTEQALRTWKFQPAVRDGKASLGTVVGVVSYLRPVSVGVPGLPNQPPPTTGPTPTPITRAPVVINPVNPKP